jgi:hypothetical protein
MDKETLSHYGWIVILVLVLSCMIALATPFGQFIAKGFESIYGSFAFVNDNLIKETEIVTGLIDPELNPKNLMPKDSIYTIKSTGEVRVGDGVTVPFPDTVEDGDIFRYLDYEYGYNLRSNGNLTWTEKETQQGWSVDTINNDQTHYGEIMESINGKPISSLYSTFYDCSLLLSAPAIPRYCTYAGYTFQNCTSLITPPNTSKANKLEIMTYTFRNCVALETAPIIPNSVQKMSYTFQGCSKLTIAPKLPDNLTIMQGTFAYCTSLIEKPKIPNTITTPEEDIFEGCTQFNYQ